MSLEKVSSNKTFEGELVKYKFKSTALGGLDANLNIFIPKQASDTSKVPVLFYLAGLTCTEDTGAQKGAFLGPAAKEGIAIVFPDTSPRGAGIEGEDADWDFGTGAGFYLDATNPKYAKHYNMLTHITKELPEVLKSLPLDFTRQSIFGHSMGGHGALTLYLQSLKSGSKQYRSVSAFAPISNPTKCPWGEKAFTGYLQGGLGEAKENYDATELILSFPKSSESLHILVDYGKADNFLKQGQLLPENFLKATRDVGYNELEVRVRAHEGYDHSYYFISTFGADHVHFHANILKA